MNHNDRRTLREKAAAEIQSGRTVSQVARKYGRTPQWVRDSCVENGVELPIKGKKRIVEIVKLTNEGKSPTEVSKEIGVSRQYIYKVLDKAE